MKQIISLFYLCFMCISLDAQSFKIKLTEHTFNVESVAYSLDGKLLASGSADGVIHIYELDSFGIPKIKQTFNGHLGSVTRLVFSKNSKYLVSSSKDYSCRLWNIDTPSLSKVYNIHMEPVTSAFLDPSMTYLVTSSIDGTIKLTHLRDNKKNKTIKMGGPINDLKLSSDRKHYYVALKGGIIKKIEAIGKNEELLTFTGHGDEVNMLELSPVAGFMASASHDKSIIIWDINTGKQVKKLSGFEWKVTCLQYSSDGRYIIGGCNDGSTKLFEVETSKQIADFKEMGKNVRSVSFCKNGKQIAVATHMDGNILGSLIYNTGVESITKSTSVQKAPSKNTNTKTTVKKTTTSN